MTRSPRLSVHLITAVWGAEYSDLFLRVLVPSMLTPGNLPALVASMDVTCRIATLAGERGRFEGTPGLARLREVVPVEVVEVALPPPRATHEQAIATMVHLHRAEIEHAQRAGAAMVFLSPDMLFADGAFATLARLALQGKRAVLISCLRLVRESFLADYPSACDAAGPAGLAPRALVALGLRHLHPWSRALIWGGPLLGTGPSILLWPVDDAGLLGHFFHLHPLFVRPERAVGTIASSVDDVFVAEACPDPGSIAIIDDSDDLVAFEVTSERDVEVWWRRQPRSLLSVAAWASRNASARHRGHFARTIVIRARDGRPHSRDWA